MAIEGNGVPGACVLHAVYLSFVTHFKPNFTHNISAKHNLLFLQKLLYVQISKNSAFWFANQQAA